VQLRQAFLHGQRLGMLERRVESEAIHVSVLGIWVLRHFQLDCAQGDVQG
jgi:hypothetical protein